MMLQCNTNPEDTVTRGYKYEILTLLPMFPFLCFILFCFVFISVFLLLVHFIYFLVLVGTASDSCPRDARALQLLVAPLHPVLGLSCRGGTQWFGGLT